MFWKKDWVGFFKHSIQSINKLEIGKKIYFGEYALYGI